MRSPRHLPAMTLAVIALIWGYSWIPGKLGVEESSAFVFAALRTFPAGVILVLLLPLTGRPLRPRSVGLTALSGVLQTGGFVGFISAALVTGDAGHTAMLANTWQFWLLPLAWLILRERLKGIQWLSVSVGFVGIVLIMEPWRLRGVVSSLLTLAGAVCFAGGAVVARILRRRREVDLLSFTAWQNLLGSMPLVVAAAFIRGDGITWSGTFIWSLCFGVFIGTALGSLLWLYVLGTMPANMAGIGTIGTPVIGVLASWLQLHESLSFWEIAGMVLIVAALGLLAAWGLRAGKAGKAQGKALPAAGR